MTSKQIYCKAQMSSCRIKRYCPIDAAGSNLLESAIDRHEYYGKSLCGFY